MRALIYILASLAMTATGAATAVPGNELPADLRGAADALAAGEATAALRRLREDVAPGSPSRPLALLEGARILYRQNRWTELFGVATYARRVYPQAPETGKVRTLEILALLRHCQLDVARARLAQQPDGATAVPPILRHWLGALPPKPAIAGAADSAPIRPAFFPKQDVWPVKLSDDELRRLDPFGMRAPMAPLCDVGGDR